ncbi:helix-turn-helix domain-containing protein [Peribacillus sp. TH14]|jgi:XRE family transcriptional regulator, regulator of sulfur utilization|uniref:helix-turn-helix domain-containing protein n=1 Tax=Peribacillus sp. TH14 TaxID=2798481 RepID=UPI001911D787|nr:helix-turn-helix domain-containing protein [Peribacillus sp. TH14]MBK5497458.1 helix-turn-helix domain-containing protein [Peribacillus sp. TH14]
MEPIEEVIANNLVNLRKKRGLSLDKVANLTGVSKAMLAQIEKGKSSPTVTTLWKIANGLQVSFSVFMKEAVKPQIEKININQLPPVIDNNGNYLVYSIFPYHPEKKFEIFTVDLKPGYSHISEKHLGEEYILIKSGELTIDIHGKGFVLTTNETINFSSSTEHSYINSSKELVSFYILIYYPDDIH